MNLKENTLKIPGYIYRNFIAPKLYSIRDQKILSRNLAIKNKYADKRCFIVGSGPSLANIDFSKLRNEYAFVCNEFDKDPRHAMLNRKFHIITDSAYYTEGEAEYYCEQFRNKDKTISTNTTMIINLAARPFVKKYGLFKNHPVYYVGTQGIFTDKLPFNIEFERYVPYPKNSALMCIMAAAYTGFKEIILIGCEHGFLAKPVGALLEHSSDDYPEDLKQIDIAKSSASEAMKRFSLKKSMATPTYENCMASVLQLFKNYRYFYQEARKIYPGIKILNATPNSYLDVFPFVNLDDTLK